MKDYRLNKLIEYFAKTQNGDALALMQRLANGETYEQLGAYFGISRQAICERVKGLRQIYENAIEKNDAKGD